MLAGVLDLALSTFHSILVKKDGSMWTSGLNANGQLGIGEAMASSKSFVQVMSGGVTAAAAGFEHTVVVKEDGSVWVTGQNSKGQLGATSNKDIFFLVGSTSVIVSRMHLVRSLYLCPVRLFSVTVSFSVTGVTDLSPRPLSLISFVDNRQICLTHDWSVMTP